MKLKILCRIKHKWTGNTPNEKFLMRITTGHDEGCIRCGLLR